MQVSIPQPCGEDWNHMIPSDGGRHCAQCAKMVVDFTAMTAEEIGFYLQLNAGSKICGRFTEDQLATDIPTPEDYVLYVLRAPLPFLKQIVAVIFFALFIGGATSVAAQTKQKVTPAAHATMGAPMEAPQKNTEPGSMGEIALKAEADTPVNRNEPTMGKIIMQPNGRKPPKVPAKKPPQILQGDLQTIPNRQPSKAQKPTLQNQHITGLVAMPAPKGKK